MYVALPACFILPNWSRMSAACVNFNSTVRRMTTQISAVRLSALIVHIWQDSLYGGGYLHSTSKYKANITGNSRNLFFLKLWLTLSSTTWKRA
ncbi:hypothetical protein BYT27DRAFT_7198717 [Phlegmacium glaucopus]|nr:hypothetical protein BYT27DRAFT_7198717 [Phlegmacium glaucopus]